MPAWSSTVRRHLLLFENTNDEQGTPSHKSPPGFSRNTCDIAYWKPRCLVMSSLTSQPMRLLSKGTALRLRRKAALVTAPTPLHSSTTSRSRSTSPADSSTLETVQPNNSKEFGTGPVSTAAAAGRPAIARGLGPTGTRMISSLLSLHTTVTVAALMSAHFLKIACASSPLHTYNRMCMHVCERTSPPRLEPEMPVCAEPHPCKCCSQQQPAAAASYPANQAANLPASRLACQQQQQQVSSSSQQWHAASKGPAGTAMPPTTSSSQQGQARPAAAASSNSQQQQQVLAGVPGPVLLLAGDGCT